MKQAPKNPVHFLFQDQFTDSSSRFPCIPGIPWLTHPASVAS